MADRPLYVILEVPKDASPEEIKKAYHRLALKYHPDKAGEDGAERFQQVLAAYTLLSDPEARAVYDRYGEQGLGNMESVPVMKEMGMSLSIMSFFRFGFAIGALVSINALVFFTLMSLKLDGKADISWYVVMIPLYLFGSCFAVATVASILMRLCKYFIHRKKDRQAAKGASESVPQSTTHIFDEVLRPKFRPKLMKECKFWFGNLMSLCGIATWIMITIASAQRDKRNHADGVDGRGDPLSWWAAFSPLVFGNVCSFATAFVFRDLLHLYGIHCVSTLELVVLNLLSIFIILGELTEYLLLICFLEGYVHIPAYYIAIPGEVYVLLTGCFLLFITRLRVQGIEKIKREMPYMTEEAQQEIQKHSFGPSRWIEVVFITFTTVLVLCGIITSTLAVELKFDFRLAFIPFFILFGTLLVVFVVLFGCFTLAMDGVADEEKEKKPQRKHRRQSHQEAEDSYSEDDNRRESIASKTSQDQASPDGATSPPYASPH